MRLLSTQNWEMEDFTSDDNVPLYAILSHTWDEEEVNFQQWKNMNVLDIGHMKGYNKIKKFGEQAAIDGFAWVWVDTCCIDKKSSAELAEAVNSMFRWYQNAVVCYVHLSDAMWCADATVMNERLRKSRWFTRGWTLQELIAPRNVEFYSADWRKIATKDQLCSLLSSITGIEKHILKGATLTDTSIARRMSWASHRKTTRVEDIAYCLLGIFDVNFPLIYGEGPKAFRRLQEAILNTTHDQSLFAWGRIVTCPAGFIEGEQILGPQPIPWKHPKDREPLLGLFANSPEDFLTSSEISPVDHGYAHDLNRRHTPTLVNGGVLLGLVIVQKMELISYWDRPAVALPHKVELAVLLCRVGKVGSQLVGLVLNPWGDRYYSRTNELLLINTFVSTGRFRRMTQIRHIVPYRQFQLRNRDILLRQWEPYFRHDGVQRPTTQSGPVWRQKWGDRVIQMEEDAEGDEGIVFFFEIHNGEGVAITFWRSSKSTQPLGNLLVGASPYETIGTIRDNVMDLPNWTPKHGASFYSPAYSHAMEIPSDTWNLEVEGLPRIYAKVDRMLLDERSGAVDVVDFFMYPERGSQSSLP